MPRPKKTPPCPEGWPFVCQDCGCTHYKSYAASPKQVKRCPECQRRHKAADTLARNNARYAEKRKARREAILASKKPDAPDYCAKMRLTNPGAMCGTRDFCRGCQFAGDGHCSDTRTLGLIPTAMINRAKRKEAHER